MSTLEDEGAGRSADERERMHGAQRFGNAEDAMQTWKDGYKTNPNFLAHISLSRRRTLDTCTVIDTWNDTDWDCASRWDPGKFDV